MSELRENRHLPVFVGEVVEIGRRRGAFPRLVLGAMLGFVGALALGLALASAGR